MEFRITKMYIVPSEDVAEANNPPREGDCKAHFYLEVVDTEGIDHILDIFDYGDGNFELINNGSWKELKD